MAQDSSLRFDLTEWARNPRPALWTKEFTAAEKLNFLERQHFNLTTSQISIFGFSVLHRMFEVLHIDWQVRTPLPRKLILQFLAFNLLPPEFNLLLSSSFLVKRFHLKKNTKSFHPRVQISMLIWF